MTNLIKGKYQIVREIARSNDIVYEAMDLTLSRRVALKELNIGPSLIGQARRDRIERFTREARAAGRLNHRNIVSVFDFGEEDGRHFIAMEFLEGMPLRDILQMRGALSQREAIEIACQILDGLAFAHAHNVIHRDIKPDNIQVLPDGDVKLTDFGIARLTEEQALTLDGQVFGTPSYMSPEQIIGKGIDPRSDLFSVAVLLYEMLSGRKPFIGDSVVSITYAIMNAAPAPLPGVPFAIEQVILRALAKDPAQRTPSAEQMKRDLRAAEMMPSRSYPPTGGVSPQPSVSGSGYFGGAVPPPLGDPGVGASNLGYPSPGNGSYAGGPPPPVWQSGPGGVTAPQPLAVGPQPWAWSNGNGATGGGAGGIAPSGPVPPGSYPFGIPPFPRRRRPIKIVVPPWVKSGALALVVAVVIGGSIGLGAVAFLNGYDRYRATANARQVSELMAQAVTAYNGKDYAQAARLLEQAKQAGPAPDQQRVIDANLSAANAQLNSQRFSSGMDQAVAAYNASDFAKAAQLFEEAGHLPLSQSQLGAIRYNLCATYIQLARGALAGGNIKKAQDYYVEALHFNRDNRTAHDELAGVLTQLNLPREADLHRAAARSSADTSPIPSSLNVTSRPADTGAPVVLGNPQSDNAAAPAALNPTPPPDNSTSVAANEQAFEEHREQVRRNAARLLSEGDDLRSRGDIDGAWRKWQDVIDTAPGTPERDEAKERIRSTSPASKSQ